MFPLIPVLVTGLVVTSYAVVRRRDGVRGMTPQRQAAFDYAIRHVKDPIKLRTLGKAFRDAGLKPWAVLLEKRAALREVPPEVKKARDRIFRRMLSHTDPAAINRVADAFAKEGATGAATALRDYAAGLVPGSSITTNDSKVEDVIDAVDASLETPLAPPVDTSPATTPAPESPTLESTLPTVDASTSPTEVLPAETPATPTSETAA